jgi:hypothetical protein
MDDIKNCPVCGQSRPFPTQPGIWEYREYPWLPWSKAKIVVSTGNEHHNVPVGGLLFYGTGETVDVFETEPCWWPTAEWRKVGGQLVKIEVQELHPWTKEWPNEPGSYWFYGRRFKPIHELEERLELSFVEVRNTAVPNVLMYVTRGHFLYKTEGADGWWSKTNIPVLPE